MRKRRNKPPELRRTVPNILSSPLKALLNQTYNLGLSYTKKPAEFQPGILLLTIKYKEVSLSTFQVYYTHKIPNCQENERKNMRIIVCIQPYVLQLLRP
jgi:hypothetical protein